jgi:hypothetical protein
MGPCPTFEILSTKMVYEKFSPDIPFFLYAFHFLSENFKLQELNEYPKPLRRILETAGA